MSRNLKLKLLIQLILAISTIFMSLSIFAPVTGVSAADTTAPSLGSIGFIGASVNYPGSISIRANITDTESGVLNAYADMRDPAGVYRASVSLTYNASTNDYRGIFNVSNYYWPNGQYYIPYVYATDNAGNYGNYYNGTHFPTPYVNVGGTFPDTAP